MSSKVERSRKTGDTAVLVLWISTAVVLAISILVSFLIFRSISKPLGHLTEGTRAIAEGKFFYRLDTTRNDEFAQLAKDFNTMTRRLNELDELKKDFVSHVSHELKAPLASMRETIQLMLEQIPGPLTDKQKRLLELNLQSGTRLTSMISNLLDLSKTEAGVMEYELKSQDLVPLVRNAIAELESHAHEKQIRIETVLPNDPLIVQCDGDRIVQVVVNLVGNAVKFSPKGAKVLMRVDEVSQIPPSVPERWKRLITGPDQAGSFGLLTVRIPVPGVPDSDKDRIFEKFQQMQHGKKMPGRESGWAWRSAARSSRRTGAPSGSKTIRAAAAGSWCCCVLRKAMKKPSPALRIRYKGEARSQLSAFRKTQSLKLRAGFLHLFPNEDRISAVLEREEFECNELCKANSCSPDSRFNGDVLGLFQDDPCPESGAASRYGRRIRQSRPSGSDSFGGGSAACPAGTGSPCRRPLPKPAAMISQS